MISHSLGWIGLPAVVALSGLTLSSGGQAAESTPVEGERSHSQSSGSDQGAGSTRSATPKGEDPAAPPDYLLPDLAPDALVHDGERFWLKPIFAVVADYTFFEQDDPSLAQVGEQNDSRDLRAARLGLALRSKSKLPWEVFFAVDYQEPRTRQDQVFQLYDLRLRLPIGPVNLDIGKQKQPFAFEIVGLSILNP